MRAVVLRAHGGPEVLRIEELADPRPGPQDVLVAIEAAGVNRADLLQRIGRYPDPRRVAVEIPGLEFAGVVVECGEQVRAWRPGDRVMGIEAGGGYATRIGVHERQLMRVPEHLGIVDAAAIPEVFLTAWDALVVQGGLTSGRWALVHAGASGVGTAAIQLCKAIGARVAVTCSAGKAGLCIELGADVVLERSPHDWSAEADAAVQGGFDVVLDVIGGEELARNLAVLARRGTLVQVGTMGGARAEVDIGALMLKRARWIGTTLRARPLEEKIALTQRFAAEVLGLFETGQLRPVVDSVYPFDQVAAAHERMAANANAGKIVLTMGSAA